MEHGPSEADIVSASQ